MWELEIFYWIHVSRILTTVALKETDLVSVLSVPAFKGYLCVLHYWATLKVVLVWLICSSLSKHWSPFWVRNVWEVIFNQTISCLRVGAMSGFFQHCIPSAWYRAQHILSIQKVFIALHIGSTERFTLFSSTCFPLVFTWREGAGLIGLSLKKKLQLFCYFSSYKNNTHSCRNLENQKSLK